MMDSLACAAAATAAASSFSTSRLLFPSVSGSRIRVRRRTVNTSFNGKRSGFCVFAANEEPELDKWDLMELKFGRLMGEDPKLTLAKIMGKKANPDASYLEIEKSFYKNKGKTVEIEEVPFDVSEETKSSNSSNGLNLVRPVPKKGIKFQSDDKPVAAKVRKPTRSDKKMVDDPYKGRTPNVILRKPTVFKEDDVDDKPSRFRIKPNLTLKMRNDQAKDRFSDITLLRKPDSMSLDEKQDSSHDDILTEVNKDEVESKKGQTGEEVIGDFTLLKKPEPELSSKQHQPEEAEMGTGLDAEYATLRTEIMESNLEQSSEAEIGLFLKKPEMEENSVIKMQLPEPNNLSSDELRTDKNVKSNGNSSIKAALQGKPKRLDQSEREMSTPSREEEDLVNPENYGDLPSVSPSEEADWTKAGDLLKTGERTDVELISSSIRGFVVSFGSLIGFLPYRNLASKWKYLAFESWLRQKGLDPSSYKQGLGITGNYNVMNKDSVLDSRLHPETDQKFEGEISPNMKLEDLINIYDQQKLKFLSSFVGQKMKLSVVMADQKSKKLVFSMRPKEKEELIEKKRVVMAKLRVGDVVKCCIKKITYFGIFVEVEGVPALIHQTEVSWDATLDPASYFKIGQIVEAKVHHLDFALDRIFLSLKEIVPDPLIEALETVVGDHDNLDGRLQVAEADTEWAEVESLIKELQQTEGIQSVSKGRFFLSPGLAPTFQVYMASMFENQYKLLARSGNKVQEVIVQTTLDKEEMKSTIISCTNRVE